MSAGRVPGRGCPRALLHRFRYTRAAAAFEALSDIGAAVDIGGGALCVGQITAFLKTFGNGLRCRAVDVLGDALTLRPPACRIFDDSGVVERSLVGIE